MLLVAISFSLLAALCGVKDESFSVDSCKYLLLVEGQCNVAFARCMLWKGLRSAGAAFPSCQLQLVFLLCSLFSDFSV